MSTKISARTAASALTGAEIVPCIQSSLDRRITVNNILQRGGALGSIRDFGCVGDGTTDDTTNLQAFFSDITGKTKILEAGTYKYTTALTLPAGGTHVQGIGSGGDFLSYLIPYDCAAFNISGVHHSLLENFLIWPQGTTPPTTIITITNTSYSIKFRDVRIHVASTYVPSTAVVNVVKGDGTNLDIIFDHVMMRSDSATYYPIGYQFGADCGDITLIGCDTEGCTVGYKHLGGVVQILGGHSENLNTNGVSLEPSTDASASFSMLGARLGMAGSGGIPIAIRAGAKNARFTGTYIDTNATTAAYVYSLSGSSNVVLDYANPDTTKFGTEYGPTAPSVIQFGRGASALPASKFTSINVTTGTLAQYAITGAQFVSLMSTNATPGNQQCRTAAQMIADHGMGPVDASYTLRITNTGTNPFTLTTNTNVTLTGTMTVNLNTYRDFIVTFNASSGTVTIQSIGTGTYS
jgi:hypothetical protein